MHQLNFYIFSTITFFFFPLWILKTDISHDKLSNKGASVKHQSNVSSSSRLESRCSIQNYPSWLTPVHNKNHTSVKVGPPTLKWYPSISFLTASRLRLAEISQAFLHPHLFAAVGQKITKHFRERSCVLWWEKLENCLLQVSLAGRVQKTPLLSMKMLWGWECITHFLTLPCHVSFCHLSLSFNNMFYFTLRARFYNGHRAVTQRSAKVVDCTRDF